VPDSESKEQGVAETGVTSCRFRGAADVDARNAAAA